MSIIGTYTPPHSNDKEALQRDVEALASQVKADLPAYVIASYLSMAVRRFAMVLERDYPELSTILDYLGMEVQSQTGKALERDEHFGYDLVETVSRFTALERKGDLFWGCCPFHNEKTPSFSVNEDLQTWNCFGCGVGGDLTAFLTFAKAPGIELKREKA